MISHRFIGCWNSSHCGKKCNDHRKGVASIFSEVRTSHQMPLSPLYPTPHQGKVTYCKPKRLWRLLVIWKILFRFFEFIDLSKPIALMTQGYVYRRTEMRESKK